MAFAIEAAKNTLGDFAGQPPFREAQPPNFQRHWAADEEVTSFELIPFSAF